MVTPRVKISCSRPKELVVYECCGSQPPSGEPEGSGFLGIWSEPPFYYLFFEQEPGAILSDWLNKQPHWVLRDRYELAYDQWQQVSAQRVLVGPFVIEMQPGPERSAGQGEGNVIRLDPGLVFGSGLHGSTKGCLLAIVRLFERFSITSVVDMGTGTGILAICCAVLGAARVFAIDKNPLAIRVARKNVFLNRVEDRVGVLVADDLKVLEAPGELLVMNLEGPSLEQLLAKDEWLRYRWVILSGFLKSHWDKLRVRIPPAFRLQDQETVDNWLTVTFSKCLPE
jgi:ribosomal protein L11 methyltransferase